MSKETISLAEIDRALARKKHGKKKAKKKAKKRRAKRRAKTKARVKVVHVHHHHGAKTHKKRATKKHAKKRATKKHAKKRATKKRKGKPRTGADMNAAERKAWAAKMQRARKRANK